MAICALLDFSANPTSDGRMEARDNPNVMSYLGRLVASGGMRQVWLY